MREPRRGGRGDRLGRAAHEFKHFSMELEFLLRKTPKWRKTAEGILFTKGDIVKHGEAAEEAAG